MEVEILAGTPPGGGQDRAARAFASALGVAAFVVNIPGRGGSNTWDELSRRGADPHVAAISSPTMITNRIHGIGAHDDVTPLARLCTEGLAFVIPASSGIRNAGDLVGAVTGGAGIAIATALGNVNHVAAGLIARAGGGDPGALDVRAFDSAREAVAEVLGGGAACAIVSAASVVPELAAGSIRVVAVSTSERLAGPFRDVSTWSEVGVDCLVGTWRGIVGPPGLTADDVAMWDELTGKAVASPEWASAVADHHWQSTYLDAASTRAFLESERATLAEALEMIGHG